MAVSNAQTERQRREVLTTRAAQVFAANVHFEGGSDEAKPKVLIVFPTYNEAGNVAAMSRSLRANAHALSEVARWAYCFVNDGSEDATEERLREQVPGCYVSHESNLGVAAVLLTAFKISTSLGCHYTVQCDADGQHPLEAIPNLIGKALRDDVDLVIGSRFLPDTGRAAMRRSYRESTTLARRIGGYLISAALRSFGGASRTFDPTSGFRVYSQRAVAVLLRTLPGGYPEPESIALCSLHKLRIVETHVRMHERLSGTTSLKGMKSVEFMVRIFTGLVSLRVRSLFQPAARCH